MADKRKRADNFSFYELNLLVELMEKHAGIIENKKTDTHTVSSKSKEWINLLEEYNRNDQCKKRTVELLQNCWKRLKQVN